MAGPKASKSGSVQLSIGSVLPGRTKSGALSKRPRKAGANVRAAVNEAGDVEVNAKRVIGSEAARIMREDRTSGRTSQGSGRMSAGRKKAARRLAEMRLLRASRTATVGLSNPRGARGKLVGPNSAVSLGETPMTAAQKKSKNKVNPDYRNQRNSVGNALRAQANKKSAKKRASVKRAAAKKGARG